MSKWEKLGLECSALTGLEDKLLEVAVSVTACHEDVFVPFNHHHNTLLNPLQLLGCSQALANVLNLVQEVFPLSEYLRKFDSLRSPCRQLSTHALCARHA